MWTTKCENSHIVYKSLLLTVSLVSPSTWAEICLCMCLKVTFKHLPQPLIIHHDFENPPLCPTQYIIEFNLLKQIMNWHNGVGSWCWLCTLTSSQKNVNFDPQPKLKVLFDFQASRRNTTIFKYILAPLAMKPSNFHKQVKTFCAITYLFFCYIFSTKFMPTL